MPYKYPLPSPSLEAKPSFSDQGLNFRFKIYEPVTENLYPLYQSDNLRLMK